MRITSTEELKTVLTSKIQESETACVITHIKPDGDGLAAALALQELYPKLRIILEKPASESFDFLSANTRCEAYSAEMQFNLVIVLDCHEIERVGICGNLLTKANDIIAIDHHLEQNIIPESDFYINEHKATIGIIIFNLFENEILSLNNPSGKYIAEAIYTTLLNDTNNFTNANVDEETFLVSSKLLKTGFIPGSVAEKFLMNKSADQMRLIGDILMTTETHDNCNILFIHCTLDMLKKHNLEEDSTDKITNYLKGTHKVKVIIFFLECKDEFRLSLRSNYINVNKIAVKFGGGGHRKASGCPMKGTLEENKQVILKEIRKQLN